MKTRRGIGGATGAALVLATLLLGVGSARADAANVPFTAKFNAQIAFTGATTAAWSGTGIAVLIGSVDGSGSITVTGGDESCPGGLANVHVATLTAANGDTLTLTSMDVACPISPYEFRGTGHWAVTGGTGRFAGTSGGGSVEGHANYATGAFTATWTGSLVL